MSVRVLSIVAIVAAGLLMSACSPINSKFSCNATAGDSCMTIEQVDAMTHYADDARAQNTHSASQQKRGEHAHPYAKNNNGHALVWVAPRNGERLNELGAAQNPTLNAHG